MKEISLKLYAFNELSPASQAVAIKNFRDKSYDLVDAEMLTENFREILAEEYGITGDIKIYWSLSHCQGDGVAFYGVVDADKFLDKHQDIVEILRGVDPECNLYLEISGKNNRYHHWNSMNIGVDIENVFDSAKKRQAELDIIDIVGTLVKGASRRLEKVGYDEIDYRSSDEYIKEELSQLDETFLESGKMYV